MNRVVSESKKMLVFEISIYGAITTSLKSVVSGCVRSKEDLRYRPVKAGRKPNRKMAFFNICE